ncbi:DUF1569 domain-containing protein [Parvicella tangerina]|uniref:DUF1569 domain-containing protein n=1 Tax=Parvicella tangerina TaxID=2829795 RepID=A0A916JLT5_9FLAO|nr:DUF1569 domain-containing protein [Parvicella tangerina]CAG5080392.1 hypothetical protein CRYO30217_01289 [Parvicella tangerina]
MSKSVNALLPELESYIKEHEKTDISVSQKSIDWQLDHSLKVINAVCKVTPQSDPSDFRPKFNFMGFILLSLGWFPRGKAKAPKAVVTDKTSEYELILQLKEAREGLKKFEQIQPKQFFEHPLFGHLNKKKTKQFLYTHTYHHLKIIREISKA